MTPENADDRLEILETISSFFSALSTSPENARSFVLPEAHAVIRGPFELADGPALVTSTLADLISRTGSSHAASPCDIAAVSPEPQAWIGGRFAAVWTKILVKDKAAQTEIRRGVAELTLFKREEGWRIGALAEKQWEASAPEPTHTDNVPAEMVAPTLELCRLLNEERWDEVESLMVPGGGATYMRFPHTLIMVGWKDFFSKMRAMLEKAKPGYVEQALMDWDGRSCGDVGVVWTPFTVSLDGEVRIRGFNVFTMLKTEGRWLISGAQDG